MAMVNGTHLECLASDVTVGYLMDGEMRGKISVRGGRTVIVAFANGPRVWEVALSPRAARQLMEITEAAARLAEGR